MRKLSRSDNKRLGVAGAVAGALLYIGANGGHFEERPHARTQQEQDAYFRQELLKIYKAQDNAGRFALQFLGDETNMPTIEVRTYEGGHGISGWISRLAWGRAPKREYGGSCLPGGAYDPFIKRTDATRIERLPGDVRVGVPEFIDGGDTITIVPDVPGFESEYPTLRFTVDANGVLDTDDPETIGVLADAKCYPWGEEAKGILPEAP